MAGEPIRAAARLPITAPVGRLLLLTNIFKAAKNAKDA